MMLLRSSCIYQTMDILLMEIYTCLAALYLSALSCVSSERFKMHDDPLDLEFLFAYFSEFVARNGRWCCDWVLGRTTWRWWYEFFTKDGRLTQCLDTNIYLILAVTMDLARSVPDLIKFHKLMWKSKKINWVFKFLVLILWRNVLITAVTSSSLFGSFV